MKKEENLQIAICQWIRWTYPEIIFQSDIASGLYLTIGQAVKAQKMRSKRGNPDIFIAEPKPFKNTIGFEYCGLFLELKKEGTKIIRTEDARKVLKGEFKLRKAGDYWDNHIEEQAQLMEVLTKKGYFCSFGIGFDDSIKIISDYLNK